MTYLQYINFYRLEKNEETKENWLANEHIHGRAYLYGGKYYSVETGEELK